MLFGGAIVEPYSVIGYVFIIIALARVLAEIFERIGYPGFLGEILAGLFLGVFLTPMPIEELNLLAEFGIFFLMMYAGLELTPEEVHIGGKKSFPLYILTYALMTFVTLPFTNYTLSHENLIVGAILSVASAPIVLRLSRFFGGDFLHVALSYAVISEIGAIVSLYILVNFEVYHLTYIGLVMELVKDGIFLGILFGINYLLNVKQKVLIIKGLRSLKSDEAVFGLVMILSTSIAFLSEIIGLHFSIGAFVVGLLLHSDLMGTKQYRRVHTIISGVTYGIFAPIFFAWRGINFETELSMEVVYFFILVYILRILLTMGFSWDKDPRKTIVRATGVASFGVLGLLVGELGYEYGVLSEHLYALASLASILGMFISTSIGRFISKNKS
ncbi:cation:proton antiporter [Thermococcus sp.]|uniref:cation:proton antiporter n=1 Tax=Thermococcus sp. TaxID=35749 RepID=UPI002629D9FF|nr:cation:proton antiporter [Thermococcus sp.]MCD6144452.1 cation:proton antiporter [Thermococcus sp.]